MVRKQHPIKLYGFNNLTKTLSFNIYDICYTGDEFERKAYIEYINQQYNSNRLKKILTEVTKIINAKILNIATQDYEPQGASVTVLVSEYHDVNGLNEVPKKDSVVGHLDKSHLTVHTYPESHPGNPISTFRVDIDVSTCGEISPLKALHYLISQFDSDIITIDYRIRGFTRDLNGEKHFLDHSIDSIQDYIPDEILSKYTTYDVNLAYTNIFHTKMMLNTLVLDNYLFNLNSADLTEEKVAKIRQAINSEMAEIYYGMNIPRMKLEKK
ncbi:MAG TPA: adenosylmethionine decarboxylase [Bacilli bacterium]|nr:MAG: S-adenosylmethionine decarboxylase proenzyme precursor [Tenericutes bacterium ADurb.BinA124]HNZ50795.1 adenosylmethionine decarboxylase [Bacilli bacterium]HOH18455.1 adenosylmethionine decarboxylase [Bacilli bacterium]HPX84332.1 adenosylmethionine decarboxylase [Bacilli bacterium]